MNEVSLEHTIATIKCCAFCSSDVIETKLDCDARVSFKCLRCLCETSFYLCDSESDDFIDSVRYVIAKWNTRPDTT